MIVNLSKYAMKSTPESHKSEDTFHSPVVLSPISGIEKSETVASCLSPVPARFLHFLLLNDFPPPSRSLEQARPRVIQHCRKTLHSRTKENRLVILIQKALGENWNPYSAVIKSFTLQRSQRINALASEGKSCRPETITTVNRYVCHDLSV